VAKKTGDKMSADNWMKCPQCLRDIGNAKSAEIRSAEQSYGKIPYTEFLALTKKSQMSIELDETLREDWEIGMNEDGTFFVDYSCRCTKCGFNYNFKQRDRVSL
jgi:hypothetical protein